MSSDIVAEHHYYAFGMKMTGDWEKVAKPENRYSYNGIERNDELGLDLAFYRSYDPAIGRWMQVDPKAEKYCDMSPYNGMGNNPILYVGPMGDTIWVNNIGTITGNDEIDNLVYLRRDDGAISSLGELGGEIDITEIYENPLEQNMDVADGMWDPYAFRDLVKKEGDWDLKVQKGTIYGLGNDGETQFNFGGTLMESQDIGNHHFGAVAQDFGFSLSVSLREAGKAQMRSGTSRPEWQVYKIGRGKTKHMQPPFGDVPRDQKWIKLGYQYARKN